jgi:hypothetical protein
MAKQKIDKTAILLLVNDQELEATKILAVKQKWSLSQVAHEAVVFYLKARKILKSC